MSLSEFGVSASDFTPPERRYERAPGSWPVPQQKPAPALRLSEGVAVAQTDQELRSFLTSTRDKTFPQLRFLVAQLDFMDEEVKNIKFTPTYAFYKHGKDRDLRDAACESRERSKTTLSTYSVRCCEGV